GELDLSCEDVSDSGSADSRTAGVEEERRGRVDSGALCEPGAQSVGRTRPEGAGALLAALTAESDQRNGIESDVTDVEVDHLLNASAGVVEEQEEGVVASLVGWDRLDQADDFGIVEVSGFKSVEASRGQFANPPAAVQVLGRNRGNEAGECLNRGQTMIA